MEMNNAVTSLAALGHTTRLTIFRYLVQAGPEGLAAGRLAELVALPPSSLSFHLKELVHAGLLASRQEGRFVIYVARYDAMNGLVAFLTENCCGGLPCSPGIALACDEPPVAMSDRKRR